MKSDKPFRKAFACAIGVLFLCYLLPRHRVLPDFRTPPDPRLLALLFAPAFITGALAYFSKETWAWTRILGVFLGILVFLRLGFVLALMYFGEYL